MALNEKQKRFVDEYLIDRNGTQAAIRAGYSEKTAAQIATRLLRNVQVQSEISSGTEQQQERTQITADRVLQEYARLAFFDPRKLFDEQGRPKPIDSLDADTAAALVGIELQDVYEGFGEDRQFIGYTKKYRLSDKKGSLDSIARHLGMFNDKLSIEGSLEHSIKNLTDEQLESRIAQLAAKAGISAVTGGAGQEEES